MAFDRSAPKKLLWSEESILEVERRLQKVQDDLMRLRTRMRDAGMDSVELTFGTFLMHLGKMEPMARQFLGNLDEQITVRQVENARNRIMQQKQKEK